MNTTYIVEKNQLADPDVILKYRLLCLLFSMPMLFVVGKAKVCAEFAGRIHFHKCTLVLLFNLEPLGLLERSWPLILYVSAMCQVSGLQKSYCNSYFWTCGNSNEAKAF